MYQLVKLQWLATILFGKKEIDKLIDEGLGALLFC